MILLTPPTTTLIFFILVATATVLVVFLYLLPFLLKYFDKKNFKKKVYKVLYDVAMENDYYLINNLPLISNNSLVAKIDHILFSNKYIYVICDKTYDGVISGNKNDNVWISYSFNGDKKEINNPLKLNKIRVEKFSQIKNIDPNYIISLVVINDYACIKNIMSYNDTNSFICRRKELRKTIKTIEKRAVSEFNNEELDLQVKEIAKEIYSRK